MNKFIVIGIIVLGLVGGGIVYKTFLQPKGQAGLTTGKVINVKVIAVKDKWIWEPEVIEATRGDKIIMEVVNEDSYDHGIAIDAFGISQRMPANSTITVEFTVTQEGEFPCYCSVPCGEGPVDGVHRTHFDMIGRLKVKPV